jgi:hypothetical protein
MSGDHVRSVPVHREIDEFDVTRRVIRRCRRRKKILKQTHGLLRRTEKKRIREGVIELRYREQGICSFCIGYRRWR